jgi:protease-4
MWFKKKERAEQKRLTVAQVLDKHLAGSNRAYQSHKYMMTLLVGVGVLMSMQSFFFEKDELSDPYIAVIKLSGEISASNKAGSSEGFAKSFQKAVNDSNAKVILIKANSGGGSPVMAEGINAIIADYKAERTHSLANPMTEFKRSEYAGNYPERARKGEWPDVIVSVEDLCASACLSSIASADLITAHKNSLVGSIGVRLDSFGLDGFLSKIGIERQVLTAGAKKDFMDPYRTMSEEDKAFIKEELMNPLHQNFIDLMKEARAGKLQLDNPLLFAGMVWTGTQSLKVGLVDEVKTTQQLEQQLMKKYGIKNVVVIQKEAFSVMNMLKSSLTDGIAQGVQNAIYTSFEKKIG